jgi:hypothetical protein
MSVVRWKFLQNKLLNFSFEDENKSTSGLALHWVKEGTPTLSLSKIKAYVKHNTYAQKIVGISSGDGISQIVDVSNIEEASFGLNFYTFIQSGTLKVKVEGLDSDEVVLGTIFEKTYSSNSELTKYEETFEVYLSAQVIEKLKITIAQSGAPALTCYLDAIIIFEDLDTTVEINPTSFSYSKLSTAEYQPNLDGNAIKIEHLDEGKRYRYESIQPMWVWLTEAQKNIFENYLGKDFILVTHEDKLFWVDLESIEIQYVEETERPSLYYGATMILGYCSR